MMDDNQEIKLTKKQEFFCRNYVSNGHNGTQAAISAGYSEKRAKEMAYENLTKPHLVEFIKKLEQPIIEKLEIDENWVITKLKNYSDVLITDFFEIKEGGYIELKNLSTIPSEKLSAIEEIQQMKDGKIKIKLVDKRACVVDLGKHLGMFKEHLEGNINHNHSHKVYVIPAFDPNATS